MINSDLTKTSFTDNLSSSVMFTFKEDDTLTQFKQLTSSCSNTDEFDVHRESESTKSTNYIYSVIHQYNTDNIMTIDRRIVDGFLSNTQKDSDEFFFKNYRARVHTRPVIESMLVSDKDDNSKTLIANESYKKYEFINGYGVNSAEIQRKLIALLKNEEFETGIVYPSETYFVHLLCKYKSQALNILSKIFMDHIDDSPKNVNILVGLLHIASHLKYENVYPNGQLIATTALSHKAQMVAEYGIKCYENWNHPDSKRILSSINFTSQWLSDYAQQIINGLDSL